MKRHSKIGEVRRGHGRRGTPFTCKKDHSTLKGKNDSRLGGKKLFISRGRENFRGRCNVKGMNRERGGPSITTERTSRDAVGTGKRTLMGRKSVEARKSSPRS